MTNNFTKRPKLTKTDHFFMFLFFSGAIYLYASLLNKPLTTLFLYFCVVYVAFFLILEYRNVKGKVYQNGIAHIRRTFNTNGNKVSEDPKIARTYLKAMDFKGYLSYRNNRNLLIAGRSGSGKSTLMRYVIDLFPDSTKTIFSFKAGDEYLKLGIPILRIADYAGNPFADKEAFVQSFLVTYTISNTGVVAASIPNLLRTVLADSDSWESLNETVAKAKLRERPAGITNSALSFIQQKFTDLELKSHPYNIDPTKDIVLDFSGLNESAKSFYAELYLRQTWHTIEASKPDPMKHIIIIDEAHRLLKSEATIFGEVARLIRSRGALWCGTQNYSDLPDYVRNQFAMHLLFSTKSEKDLKALKEINPLLPFLATELKDHHFTDAATRELHDAIPIYTTDIRKFKDMEENYIIPEINESSRIDIKSKELPDYKEKVLEMLTEEASWPSKLARDIAKQDNTNPKMRKVAVVRALKTLREDGSIERRLMVVGDREVMLYYKKDPSMSGLHKFMERDITKKLEAKGIAYELAKPGEDKPDIMTKDFDIEIETGLKRDLRKLEEKLANATKKTYIVVPSEAEKERYEKLGNATVIVAPFVVDPT